MRLKVSKQAIRIKPIIQRDLYPVAICRVDDQFVRNDVPAQLSRSAMLHTSIDIYLRRCQ